MVKPPRSSNKEGLHLDLGPLSDPQVAESLSQMVATHHPKIGHPQVGASQFVRRLETVRRKPEFRHGVCSLSIDSAYGLGATMGGQQVGLARALSSDLGQELPCSVLGSLGQGRNQAPDGLDGTVWQRLKEAFEQLKDRAPKCLTQFERLVFFESAEDEVLLTPIGSLKLVYELNRRLKERRRQDGKAPKHGRFPLGGTKPHNMGHFVESSRYRNTQQGALPVLLVWPPEDRRDGLRKRFDMMAARRSYAAVAQSDPATLLSYGRRAIMQADLATHRHAERREAQTIAARFVELAESFRPRILSLPPLDQIEPWSAMAPDERAWLDPRLAPYDRPALARAFAVAVKRRVERAMNRRGEEDGKPVFVLPDRSVMALVEAFEEVL